MGMGVATGESLSVRVRRESLPFSDVGQVADVVLVVDSTTLGSVQDK